MMKLLSALLSGLIFGLGLTVSGMTNPQKVIGFLDLFGNWDPSLAVVMGAALVIVAIGYPWVQQQSKPLYDEIFIVPTNRKIDPRLAMGAVIFGIGWGLAGLCPGPAIASMGLGHISVYAFVVSMVVGMFAYRQGNNFLIPSPDSVES